MPNLEYILYFLTSELINECNHFILVSNYSLLKKYEIQISLRSCSFEVTRNFARSRSRSAQSLLPKLRLLWSWKNHKSDNRKKGIYPNKWSSKWIRWLSCCKNHRSWKYYCAKKWNEASVSILINFPDIFTEFDSLLF